MAPRRPRKVGLKRIDAAVDNLSSMGFSPHSIRNKVKSLLRLYGGDEAWPFIEEASYKLVIESLLEDQETTGDVETEDDCKDLLEGTSGQGGMVTEPPECGSLHTANEPLCSDDHQDVALPSPIPVTEPVPLPLAGTTNNTITTEANDDVAGLTDTGMYSAPSGSEHLLQGCAKRKRKPCYGWIGPKDEDDIIYLKPYPIEG